MVLEPRDDGTYLVPEKKWLTQKYTSRVDECHQLSLWIQHSHIPRPTNQRIPSVSNLTSNGFLWLVTKRYPMNSVQLYCKAGSSKLPPVGHIKLAIRFVNKVSFEQSHIPLFMSTYCICAVTAELRTWNRDMQSQKHWLSCPFEISLLTPDVRHTTFVHIFVGKLCYSTMKTWHQILIN